MNNGEEDLDIPVRFNFFMRRKMYNELNEMVTDSGSSSIAEVIRCAVNQYITNYKLTKYRLLDLEKSGLHREVQGKS
jgi:metal-responsive CopG/Arc/MetJ family transcriptional regulator